MAKRTGKFYYKNEKQTMRDLGFKPTIASGSGWLEKEDGQSENAIAQLKSTDSQSINVSLLDIQKLEHNSRVSHKRPVFIIQFLQTNDTFLVMRPDENLLKLIHSDYKSHSVVLSDKAHINKNKKVESGQAGRDNFYKERSNEYAKQSETHRKVRRPLSKEKPNRELEPRLPIRPASKSDRANDGFKP